MLKSPQIIIFKALLYSLLRIVSRELKKCIKFPDGDLYTDNIQKSEEEKCEFTAQISISWSLQNSLKSMFVNDKVSWTNILTPPYLRLTLQYLAPRL